MATEVFMPDLGMLREGSTLVRWRVGIGERVVPGQVLFEAESEKALVEIEAASGGVVLQLLASPGEMIPVGQVIALIGELGEAMAEAGSHDQFFQETEPSIPRPSIGTTSPTERIVITPIARKLAREAGIDISSLIGSGPHGRIVEADVQAVLSQQQTRFAAAASNPLAVLAPGLRAVIARRMAESSQTTARVTLLSDVSADALVDFRRTLNQKLAHLGLQIPYVLLLAVLTARGLQEFPYMNSSMREEGILYHPQINIGIAVDTDSGLVVPVIKDVANRKILDLLKNFHNLVEKARSGRAGKDDISGGTFTITNLGMYRVDAFTPVINLPECAILGLGRIRKQPVERHGEIVIGQIATLSLSFDHRLVDGSPAARFLDRICELIEQPALALTGLALD